ncbi:MAG: hypothetical protein OEZ06_04500 [Myxococcales bacterium]|nr:hypothetical protein [Myxococcales bacterium]
MDTPCGIGQSGQRRPLPTGGAVEILALLTERLHHGGRDERPLPPWLETR